MKSPKVSLSPLSTAIGGCVAISKTVIPGEPKDLGRDPWFDRLTTLSEVEGESRKLFENQTILDLPPTRGREMTNYNTAYKKDGAIWHIVVMTTGMGTEEK